MAGEYGPLDDRGLAVRVVTRGLHNRPVPGTRGHLQKLNQRELEYLRWLAGKVLAELRGPHG